MYIVKVFKDIKILVNDDRRTSQTFRHKQLSEVLLLPPPVGVAALLECLVVVLGGGQLFEGGLVECLSFVGS